MISICENTEELDFLPADPYAARITALADTYGLGRDFAMFWVQSVGSVPVAAVSRIDGNLTVCCKENADYDELSAFLGAVGWSSITAEKSVLSANVTVEEGAEVVQSVIFSGCTIKKGAKIYPGTVKARNFLIK